jgi:hypothetical protein
LLDKVTDVFNVSFLLNRKYLFKRVGWPLNGPLGFFFGLYWGPWNLQKGHLPRVERLASKFSTQSQHAGLPIHWRQTNPECAALSKQIGQVNQTSLASMAHAGISIGWACGGLLFILLGLAGCLAGDLAGDLVGDLAGGLCLAGCLAG